MKHTLSPLVFPPITIVSSLSQPEGRYDKKWV